MPSKLDRVKLRDGDRCPHCGTTAFLTLQHRTNRGMGGSKLLDRPSNLIALCAEYNSAIEQHADLAAEARERGWKVSRYDDPAVVPVYDIVTGRWFRLGDRWERVDVTPRT